MDPESAQRVLGAIEQAIDQWSTMWGTPVLTCMPACRGPLRKLTEKFFPQLVIISHNEIPQNVKVESFGVVGISHATA
jgi:flagellar biosynthesis protein FlhA